ncbi:MAG: asparagine synthase-related protein, partial [Flavobacteriales bacterium]
RAFLNHYADLKYLQADFINTYKERFANRQREVYGNALNSMLSFEYFNYPLKELLKCEDRSSMWFSLESRTPFADDLPLMNLLFSIPASAKLFNGESKAILRAAMRGILPDEIRSRRDKMGFVTPNNLWIAQLKEHFIPYFEHDKSGILNTDGILKDYKTLLGCENEPENYRLFRLISFAVWMKVFGMK